MLSVYVQYLNRCKMCFIQFMYNVYAFYSIQNVSQNELVYSTCIKHCVRSVRSQKESPFGVYLLRIFPHSDWVRGDTQYLSVFSSNAGKYEPE